MPEYAEGELTLSRRLHVERHLSVCRRCRAELRDVTIVIGALRSVPQDPLPPHLVPRVRRAVHQTVTQPVPNARFWVRAAVPIAAALCLAALAIGIRSPLVRGILPSSGQELARVAKSPEAQGPVTRGDFRGRGMPHKAQPKPNPPLALPGTFGGGALGSPALGSYKSAPSAPTKDAADRAKVAEPKKEPIQMAAKPNAPEVAAKSVGQAAPDKSLKGSPRLGTALTAQAAADRAATEPAPRVESGVAHPDTATAQPEGGAPAAPPSGAATQEAEPRPSPEEKARAPIVQGKPAPLAISVLASVVRNGDRTGIAIRFVSQGSPAPMKISFGSGSSRRTVRRDAADVKPVILSRKEIGAGPAVIPIAVEFGGRSRTYLLFAPTMARLGDLAEESPDVSFVGEPLREALARFGALTGMVVLAEMPLSGSVSQDIAPQAPSAALEELVAPAGLRVEPLGRQISLLTRSR